MKCYRNVKKQMQLEPAETELVKKIFETFLLDVMTTTSVILIVYLVQNSCESDTKVVKMIRKVLKRFAKVTIINI